MSHPTTDTGGAAADSKEFHVAINLLRDSGVPLGPQRFDDLRKPYDARPRIR